VAAERAAGADAPLLLVGGDVRTFDPRQPRARAVLVRRRRIAWIGDDPDGVAPPGCRVVDLDGTTVQPAFVNAHTHLTTLGLTLGAMDLAVAGSLEDCLAAVRATVDVAPHPVLYGVGWDETGWPEHRAPTADELAEAGGGRPVVLLRADGHCVVVDRTSLGLLPLARAWGVERGADGAPTGLLRQEAAEVAQRWFAAQLPAATLEEARRLAARELAAVGVASAHEMGGPHRMGAGDFDAWISSRWPIEVIAYWGEPDLDFVVERGLRRVGGSLLLDGTIGSHSAALEEPYLDRAGSGQLYHDTADLQDFALRATQRGVQVAFHAIGDRAVAQAVAVYEHVAEVLGPEHVRRIRHRVEYAALVGADDVRRLAALGVVVTAQPAGDLVLARAGGPYEQRLGAARARLANPLGLLDRAGVTLAFGSDGIAAIDPWAAVAAAEAHPDPAQRVDAGTALRAATLGGRAAARQRTVGPLRAGHRADLAAFEQRADGGRRCALTMVAGEVTHGAEVLPGG
jgi:predicted amidohydrolase YtcJ